MKKLANQTESEFWIHIHYLRLLLTATSMAMVTASSQILFLDIEWEIVLIVGLSTHIVYNIDNIIDWNREKTLLRSIQEKLKIYFFWWIITIPISIILIFGIVLKSSLQFAIMLALLGGFSGFVIAISRKFSTRFEQSLYYWLERLFVTLTWSLSVTLLPMAYFQKPLTIHVLLAIIFIWMISWVIGVVWRYTSVIAISNTDQITIINQRRIAKIMIVVSFLAVIQAILDTYLGIFPLIHYSVASIPAFSAFYLAKWDAAYKYPLKYCSFLLIFISFLLISITFLHIYI